MSLLLLLCALHTAGETGNRAFVLVQIHIGACCTQIHSHVNLAFFFEGEVQVILAERYRVKAGLPLSSASFPS